MWLQHEEALAKKTHLLFGIDIKNMLSVHSQITLLKDLPFRYEGKAVGDATSEGLSLGGSFSGRMPVSVFPFPHQTGCLLLHVGFILQRRSQSCII